MIKNMKDLVSNDDNEVVSVKPKKSNGQLFKEKFGYSKTFKRNMKKNEILMPETYRKFRTERKKKLKAQLRKITPEKAAKVEVKSKKKK